MLRAPGFWWRSPGLESRLLHPLGAVYGAVTAWRMRRPGARSALPVICVGNFVAGGAGKTPFALEIADRLTRMGERPAFLTRGHGGSLTGPVMVQGDAKIGSRHGADEVGDEALLLAACAPTVLSHSRSAGAKLAEAAGATVIVMDDGLQNPSLRKDFAFAVLDGETAIGNGSCLPAGPLRAPLAAQWPFVQALIVMGKQGRAAQALAQEARRRGLAVLAARLVPEAAVAAALAGQPVIAFAGIGRPEKFFATLREIGAHLIAEHGFADHHRFAAAELAALAAEARAKSAILVTTQKDRVRIGATGELPDIALRDLPVRLQVDDPSLLDALIAEGLGRRRMAG
ncbi:lipid-A-disaccharide kinase [Rhizobiales bacterium GAS113]|nr:lipid-A-disaccharide kinase [Rhizobiales bacterium GAS113]